MGPFAWMIRIGNDDQKNCSGIHTCDVTGNPVSGVEPMNRRILQVALIAAIAAIVGWPPFVTTAAGQVFRHRQRTYNSCCLPLHHYGHDDQRLTASTIAAAPAGGTTTVNQFTGETDAKGDLKPKMVQKKIFTPLVPSLTVAHVGFSKLSLSIYNTGVAECTGTISNSGGPQGALMGSNVTIYLRAYAGVPQHPNVANAAPMLWETTHKLWVSRGPSQAISLLPGTATTTYLNGDRISFTAGGTSSLREEVRRRFDQITHLEVELQYHKDR